MSKTSNLTIVQRYIRGLALILLLDTQAALAADTPPEHTELAAAIRHLDMLDRLAASSANLPQERSRYHFDYARLRDDIARMRAGIRDYLNPPRAQPRDPEELLGGYRQESKVGGMP
jgi:RAQPRD family integrative conjugative element protein